MYYVFSHVLVFLLPQFEFGSFCSKGKDVRFLGKVPVFKKNHFTSSLPRSIKAELIFTIEFINYFFFAMSVPYVSYKKTCFINPDPTTSFQSSVADVRFCV